MMHLDELLSAYLDGETDPSDSRRADAHLRECLRCRRSLERLQEARAAVRSLPYLRMPPELVPLAGSERARSHRPVWLGAAAAAAAIVVAVAALAGRPAPEPIDLSDLSRQIGARAALDSGAGSINVVLPGPVTE